MQRLNLWNAFKDIAIIFSFVVNFVLVVLLLVMSLPALRAAFALKTGLVEPLLSDLDAAFVGLSEATIDTEIQIDKHIPIQFDLPLDQDTVVVLRQSVPLSLPARFVLPGGGGQINGSVSFTLPAGLSLPVRLSMVVPVSQTIPIQMDVPVRIKLGEAGLNPAVEELRAVFRPLKEQVENLPDGIEFP